MPTKTRNWLIAFFILALPFVLFLGFLFVMETEPLPPIASLPNPNGYDDLVKAGKMVTADVGDYDKIDEAQLRELVATNVEALQLLRAGLSNQCRVPAQQFSQTNMENHLNELAGFKRLAQVLAAEGRLAEMDGHPRDATKSYLDVFRFGTESARGGVIIDQMVGVAIEAIGVAHLQKLVDQLDAKSCHETAATLETLDSQGLTWQQVMQQERDWSRRAYPGVRYDLVRLMSRNSTNKALQKAEQKIKQQELRTRQLTIALAARAYELEKGHPSASVADLVPDYLKTVPQNPITGTNLVYSP